MYKVLLATTLKNRFKKYGNFECNFKNIKINGENRGCDGFITNPVNNRVVYLTTEKPYYRSLCNQCIYRRVRYVGDYGKGHSNFCTEEELVDNVVRELTR